MTFRLAAAAVTAMVACAAVAQSLDDERTALSRARATGREAAARAAKFEASAAAQRDESGRLRADSAAIAASVQLAETQIDAAEAQIAVIETLRAQQRAGLAAKQGPTIRLMAALQTLARRPPLLALVQPGSVTDLVHVHALLAGVLPQIRARTAGLRAEIERGRHLREAAETALAERRAAQADLVLQRQRLAALEVQSRFRADRLAFSAMTEQDRAIAMGEEARDITGLMRQIGEADHVRARLETLPGPLLRPAQPGAVRATPVEADPIAPAVPAYRLPVVGRVTTGLGEVSSTGVRAKGLTLTTRPDAQVVAPTSGHIVYAGPFRGYGQIVVVDHGSGWTTLMTGLAALDVHVGDQVDQGAPIGRTGSERPTVTVELRRNGEPVDIARLAG